MSSFLIDLLKPDKLTHVVDVGANPIDGPAPYQEFLRQKFCSVTGFEPQDDAREKLIAQKSELETYLPYAVGDGADANLYVCAYSGFSSLLKPCNKSLNIFSEFIPNARVLDVKSVQTHRLDEIEELRPFDLLKIDVQGSELSIFNHGPRHLKNAVAVHVEVSFIPLYEGQPVFGVIDLLLRKYGFLPHTFVALKNWKVGPLARPDSQYKQCLEADILYIKDLVSPSMSNEQLKQLCIILHCIYGSYDAAGYCILLLIGRGVLDQSALEIYRNHYLI